MSWKSTFVIVMARMADPFLARVVRPGWALSSEPRALGSQGIWVATTFTSSLAVFFRLVLQGLPSSSFGSYQVGTCFQLGLT